MDTIRRTSKLWRKKINDLPCVGGRYRRRYPGWQNGNGSPPSTDGTSRSPTKHRMVVTGPILFLGQGSFHVTVATGTGLKHGPKDNGYFTSTVCCIAFTNMGPAVVLQITKNKRGHLSKFAFKKCANLLWPTVFGNIKQQYGRRSKFWGFSSFWKCKTTMWQAFEHFGGQQFLEVQNNNVAGVRTLLVPAVVGNVKQQCGRGSKFCWGSEVFGNAKQQYGRRSNFGRISGFCKCKTFYIYISKICWL